MTPYDLKLEKMQKYGFMHIKRKLVTHPGNVKTDVVYIMDIQVTSNDL